MWLFCNTTDWSLTKIPSHIRIRVKAFTNSPGKRVKIINCSLQSDGLFHKDDVDSVAGNGTAIVFPRFLQISSPMFCIGSSGSHTSANFDHSTQVRITLHPRDAIPWGANSMSQGRPQLFAGCFAIKDPWQSISQCLKYFMQHSLQANHVLEQSRLV